MKTIARALTVSAAVLLLVTTAVEAKRRGGAGGNGGGNGGAGATLQKGSGGPQGQQAGGRGAGTASQDRQKQRLHVPDQQRGRYQDCAAAGDRLRRQGRELAKAAKGSNFSAAEARRQRDQLHQSAGSMFQEHDRLMGNLGENARAAIQDRTRTLDQDRDRIHAHLQAMDRELGRGNPDPTAVRAEARKLNRAMTAWQKHYRQLGNDLGVSAAGAGSRGSGRRTAPT